MSELSKEEEILREAKDRFQACKDWEGDFRKLFTDDLKFCNADSDNGYQWPDAMRAARQGDARPCLTINKTRQHALMVINEAKENKPSIRISAVGGNASYESAQVFEGITRHIEYQSNASDAYDTALEFQVKGGVGYWRVVTEYAGNDSFDQEAYIRRIRNPLAVFLDPNHREADGSDSAFGFIFDDMKREDFERKYPSAKDKVSDGLMGEYSEWCNKDTVRVAEYYCIEYTKDTLLAIPVTDPTGQTFTRMAKLSELREIDGDVANAFLADKTIQRRTIQEPKVRWYLLAGDAVIDESDWPGSTIPIVKVVGEEMLIDGKLDRKGHVRNLKDPQRMYNYWTSSAVEHVALQSKTPYVAGMRSIEGLETFWETANTENHSYLPYNDVDDQGNPLTPPQRQDAPQMSAAYLQGMQASAEEMKMVSGQNDALMGAPSNELAGIAIRRRQAQGDRATMHFRDNLAKAVRYTGKILVDIIPKIYDTERVIRILAEDGSDDTVTIDPTMQQPMVEKPRPDGEGVDRIFNPAVGQYEVIADTGPSYASKREDAFDAMTMLAQQNPQFLGIAGDLFMRAADFPMADELAERFANSIPANVKGEGPSPELQQAQQQIQQLQAQLAASMQAAADNDKKAADKDRKNEIDNYKAITDRLEALMAVLPPEMLLSLGAQAGTAAQADPMPIDQPQVQQQPALPAPPKMPGLNGPMLQ